MERMKRDYFAAIGRDLHECWTGRRGYRNHGKGMDGKGGNGGEGVRLHGMEMTSPHEVVLYDS